MNSMFQSCMKHRELVDARRMQCLIIDDGHEGITLLSDHLIRLFAQCEALNDANRVFCKVVERSIFTWNAIISAHEKLREPEMVLELYRRMQGDGVLPDIVTYLCVLKVCGGLGDLDQGRLIHEEIILSGLEADANVGSTVINMYAKCGELKDARLLFDTLSNRNVVTWGAMIAGYAQNCEGFCALQLFQSMCDEGVKPSVYTFSCALKACGIVRGMHEGRLLHHEILKLRYEGDVVIGGALISMYSDSGCLEEAQKVFNCLPDCDVVSWGIMISGYVACGDGFQALKLFEKMQGSRIKPSMVIYLCILQACGIIKGVEKGRFIHHEINEKGMDAHVLIKNTLIDMYAKCGSLDEALCMFECLPQRDIVSWGALIAGLVENGRAFAALELCNKMVHWGIMPNRAIFLCILKACSDGIFLWQGRLIHEQIVINGLDSERVVRNALVDMYMHFGCLEEARQVFDGILDADDLSWGIILAGYANNGQGFQAIEVFEEMQEHGLKPNKVILLLMLKACGEVCAVGQGRHVHMHVLVEGLQMDIVMGSAVIDMYSKCGNLGEARKVFDEFSLKDVVLYGSMIEGYARHGHGLLALELFVDMNERDLELSKAILLSLLKACSSIKAIGWGFSIHHYCCEWSLNCDVEIGSTTLDLYAKCSYLKEAHKVFDELKDLDLISWSAIILGCVEEGQDFAAIELYETMRQKGFQLDNVLLLSILKACMSIGAIEHGRMIHNEFVKIGLNSDDMVRSRLCDTYAGCGMLEEALKVSTRSSETILYSASSAKHEQRDEGQYAGECFRELVEGLKPIDPTFSAILAACSHAGMVREACSYFNAITQDYGVTPNTQHYTCMVDLLGRAGHLVEAENLVRTAPRLPDSVMQISLLTNSKMHTAMELGSRCFEQVGHSAGCISLSALNVSVSEYATTEEFGKWLVTERNLQRSFLEHNQCHSTTNYHNNAQLVTHLNVAEHMLRATTLNDLGYVKLLSSGLVNRSMCDASMDVRLYGDCLGGGIGSFRQIPTIISTLQTTMTT